VLKNNRSNDWGVRGFKVGHYAKLSRHAGLQDPASLTMVLCLKQWPSYWLRKIFSVSSWGNGNKNEV